MSDKTLPFTVNLGWSTVNWVKQHRYALALKTPAKSSENSVYICRLLQCFAKLSIETNSVDLDQTDLSLHCLYERLLNIPADDKSSRILL